MDDKVNQIGETGLQFFGKMTASTSHEIKNALAIINENAGLLEDLTLMASQGKPLDPARLKKMATVVKKQIERADGIIKNMNRFAHSIDETVSEVDLNSMIELFMNLTARFAAMRGITVTQHLPAKPLAITTAQFYLMNLLWLCLEFAMSASGDEKQVELVFEEKGNSVLIRFRKLTGFSKALSVTFPSHRELDLATVLNAVLTADSDREEVVLQLSKKKTKRLTKPQGQTVRSHPNNRIR